MVSVDCHGTACAWDCATSACTACAKLAHKPGHAAICMDLGEHHFSQLHRFETLDSAAIPLIHHQRDLTGQAVPAGRTAQRLVAHSLHPDAGVYDLAMLAPDTLGCGAAVQPSAMTSLAGHTGKGGPCYKEMPSCLATCVSKSSKQPSMVTSHCVCPPRFVCGL